MSVKKRGKMGEKTEEGCRELLKKIKTNWPSSHVLNTAAAHPGRDTGLPRQPDQTAGRGWDGWRCCWETGWWWNCRQRTPGEEVDRTVSEIFSHQPILACSNTARLLSGAVTICDSVWRMRPTHPDKSRCFPGVTPSHHPAGLHRQLVHRLENNTLNSEDGVRVNITQNWNTPMHAYVNELHQHWLQVTEGGSGLHTETQLLLEVTTKRHLNTNRKSPWLAEETVVFCYIYNGLGLPWRHFSVTDWLFHSHFVCSQGSKIIK